jgi:LSM domain
LAVYLYRSPFSQGFDEYSNLVLDDVEEINVKTGKRISLGRILQKGDSITLIAPAPDKPAQTA